MKSVKAKIDKRRLTYTRLIGEIHDALNKALTEEHAARKLTKAEMAKILGVDRASITKLLSGTRNMRLETLADLAYALDRPVKVLLPSRSASNQYSGTTTNVNAPPAPTKPANVDVTPQLQQQTMAAVG